MSSVHGADLESRVGVYRLLETSDRGVLALMERHRAGGIDLRDPALAEPISGTRDVLHDGHESALRLADNILDALADHSPDVLINDTGLWLWLTLRFHEDLFPAQLPKDRYRMIPSPFSDHRKAWRHAVRTPVLLRHRFGDDALHLVSHAPSVRPEIVEQLTSQSDLLSPAFVRASRMLYMGESGRLRRGHGDKISGGARRLVAVRAQLAVTWNLHVLPAERFLELLPAEFDRFKQ